MESAQQNFGGVQLGANAQEANVLKAHAAPLELCDNPINALKLVANE